MNKIAEEIKKIIDYFAVNDKTPFEHWAYSFLGDLYKEYANHPQKIDEEEDDLPFEEAKDLFLKKFPPAEFGEDEDCAIIWEVLDKSQSRICELQASQPQGVDELQQLKEERDRLREELERWKMIKGIDDLEAENAQLKEEIERLREMLNSGRHYLMSVDANKITVEDALGSFGFGRNGLQF